jgi:hypothetical protein
LSKPQVPGAFDHSRKVSVPLPAAAARGNDDSAGREGPTDEFDFDRSIERCAAVGAGDLLDEDSVDNPDEFELKGRGFDASFIVTGSLSGGRCQLHHVIGPIGAPSAADQL